MINVGALWKNLNPKKKTIMYGKIRHITVAVFENYEKTKPTDPDYIVVETTAGKSHETNKK